MSPLISVGVWALNTESWAHMCCTSRRGHRIPTAADQSRCIHESLTNVCAEISEAWFSSSTEFLFHLRAYKLRLFVNCHVAVIR